jgi:exopolyphosphatase/guanosine-5'-triphosphate,3'-diphosphate pyrophosphatase
MPKKKGGKISAVIEIGSDMVTMLIAQNQGGGIVELDRLECFFDLEKEIATTGRISQPSILELCRILGGFQQEMAAFGVEQYKLFSTDFLRSAENFTFFYSQLTGRAGMLLTIIDDEEEKALLYWRMQKTMASFDRDKGDKYLYTVIGNESLGLALQSGKRQRLRQNLPVTTFDVLQMREEIAADMEAVAPVMNEYLEDGLDGLDSYGFRKSVKTLVFADASLEAISRMCGVTIEDGRCIIPAEKLIQLGRQMMEMLPEEAGKVYGLSLKEERAVYAGVLIYQKMAELTGVSVVIGVYGSLSGSLLEQLLLKPERKEYDQYMQENALGCARTLAKRHGCAMEHAEKVADFAEKLYQKTRKLHPGSDDLLYLKLACILHNCGYFSDIEHHARCSASLIESFNLPGMSADDRHLIAEIQQPGLDHSLRVQQLRAYFLLADALDLCKKQKLSDIAIRFDGDKLTVTTVYDGNLYLEKKAFDEAGKLFYAVFGVQPVLHVKTALLK